MKDELHILRSDDLGALIRAYADRSWQSVGETVMEVLQETLDPQDAADMTPQEWVYQDTCRGRPSDHGALALEVRLELTARTSSQSRSSGPPPAAGEYPRGLR
jgi:hypothetical protein